MRYPLMRVKRIGAFFFFLSNKMVTSTRDLILENCRRDGKDVDEDACDSVQNQPIDSQKEIEEKQFFSSVICLEYELLYRLERDMNLDPFLSSVIPRLLSALRREERDEKGCNETEEERQEIGSDEEFEWIEEEGFHMLPFFHKSCKEDLEYLYRVTSQYLNDHQSSIDHQVIRMCLNGKNRVEKNHILTSSPSLRSYFKRRMLEVSTLEDFLEYERWMRYSSAGSRV